MLGGNNMRLDAPSIQNGSASNNMLTQYNQILIKQNRSLIDQQVSVPIGAIIIIANINAIED